MGYVPSSLFAQYFATIFLIECFGRHLMNNLHTTFFKAVYRLLLSQF